MAQWLYSGGRSGGLSLGSGGTAYSAPSGNTGSLGTEALTQLKIGGSFVASNLGCRVTAITGTATLADRLNGAPGGQAISITTTGIKEDLTGTTALAIGDLYNYQLTQSGGVSDISTRDSISVLLDDLGAGSLVPFLGAFSSGISAVLGACWFAPFGDCSSTTTESAAQTKAESAAVFSGLRLYFSANTFAAATTYKTRINGADGGQAISVAAGATGSKEDLTGTDSLVASDLFCIGKDAGGTSGSATIHLIQLSTASAVLLQVATTPPGSNISANLTRYQGLGRVFLPGSIEASAQIRSRTAAIFSALQCNVLTNTQVDATVVDFRVSGNSPAGAPAVSVAAGATGIKEDLSGAYSAHPDDLINFRVVTGTGSGSIGFSSIGILQGVGAQLPPFVFPPPARLMGLMHRRQFGPPILLIQEGFQPAGNDRFLGSPQPGQQKLRLGGRFQKGPPILLNQDRQSAFPTEGSDRFQDSPIAHPRLRIVGHFHKGPPILLSQNYLDSAAGTGLILSVSEVLSFAEAQIVDFAQNINDAVLFVEAPTLDVGKASSETITLTDAKASALSMALSQSLVLAEAIAKNIGLAPTEPIAFSESLTDAFAVELSEMFNLIDTKIVDLQVAKSQGLTLNEQIALSTLKALSESTVFSDSVVVGRIWHVEPGSFAVTGVDAALRASRKILADPGAYNLTGETARLIAARLIVLGTGRFTETPKAQRFILARAFIAAKGTVTESGKSARLLAARVLTATKGALHETGKSIDFVLFGRRTLTAETGRFILTGKSVQILVGDGRYPATREWLKRGTRHHWDGL